MHLGKRSQLEATPHVKKQTNQTVQSQIPERSQHWFIHDVKPSQLSTPGTGPVLFGSRCLTGNSLG